MLINDVEVVYTPEGVVSSLVRLEALDRLHGKVGGSLQARRDVRLHILMGGAYWEFGLIGRSSPVMKNQCVSKMIECRMNVMDAVTGHRGPVVRNGLPHAKAVDFLLSIRICLFGEKTRPACAKGYNLGFEISSVLFGPIDLY